MATRLSPSLITRLATIHPEQLQMALDGQTDAVYGYSFILTDIYHQPTAWIDTAVDQIFADVASTSRLRCCSGGRAP